jgi:Ca-activated chloride channel family protein
MNSASAPSTGLIAWLENTRVTLPLKGVEASFDVRGDLVSVELRQIYHQDRTQPLDVLYTFPLPGGAAVYRCEMVVNDRVISAKVMELEEARKVAAEKKAAGHRTALVESVRENLFELALGNLAPGDTVVIRLAWFQTLDTAGHDRSFRIPFTPGVRYIPGTPLLRSNTGKGTVDDTDQVPDASRLTPPRVDQFHPDAAWASIEGRIQLEGVDAAHLASPSHTLILREADGAVTARLAGTGEVPDRDFVLRLPGSTPAVLTPAAWLTRENGCTHALVRIIAPATAPATLAARDVYFLVDRSGSMSGMKWCATCKAFRAFIANLMPHDRAWVTFFESSFRDLAEAPLPSADILAEHVVQTLESWPVGGGTELLPALDHVLTALQKHSAGRSPVIVLITDGQVGNEATIIERMKTQPEVRVFCYGIDTAVNDAFLKRLASQQRGACSLATPHDDLVGTIAGLATRLRHPVFTRLQPPGGWELPGGAIPDLYAGECLTVCLKGANIGTVNSLRFAATDGQGAPATLICPAHSVNDPEIRAGDSSIARLWAKERIDFLLAENQRAAAIELSIRANIVCQYTAFIAWDEVERLAITGPNREVYQPAILAEKSLSLTSLKRGDSSPAVAARSARHADLQAVFCREGISDEPAHSIFFEGKVTDYQKACSLAPGGERVLIDADPGELAEWHDSPGACLEPFLPDAGDDEWHRLLSSLPTYAFPPAALAVLGQWCRANPAEEKRRRQLVVELAHSLVCSRNPRLDLARWVRLHLSAAFEGYLLKSLRLKWHFGGGDDEL